MPESLDEIFSFLGTKQQALPEGGNEFSNSGFIGQVLSKKAWKFWSGENIKFYTDQLPYKKGVDYMVSSVREDSHFYYFFDQDAGKAAAKVLKRYDPDYTWRFEMPIGSVKSFRSPTAAEKWGQSISADTQIASLFSRKHRHEYHMITLPSLIDAFARRAGMLTESIWNCHELLDASAENLTDEFEWRMIGHPDANDQDKEQMAELLDITKDITKAHDVVLGRNVPDNLKNYEGIKIHYTYSVLWQRRAELWKALGENNPDVYMVADTATTEKGKELETSATTKLNRLLMVSTTEWEQPIWVQMYTVDDPRVGSAYSSGGSTRRPRLPVIGEIFKNEADAIAATGGDGVEVASVQAADSTTPPYPAAWIGSEADFRTMLADVKASNPTKPMVLIAKDFACTVDEITAWWDLV